MSSQPIFENIGDSDELHGRVPRLADDVTLMPGAYLEHGTVVEEGVYIGPNAVVLADRSAGAEGITSIRRGAVIGANATVLPGLTIGMKARIAPGAVVTRSVPPLAVVSGNPAIITGYVDSRGSGTAGHFRVEAQAPSVRQSMVKGVMLHTLRLVPDLRGNLSVGEFDQEIPFEPRRYFIVFDVPTAETRGEHAHLRCRQFMVAVKGSVSVVADDGQSREEFVLDSPNLGLYMPPMIWGIQYRYSSDAILLVFASEHYDPGDYIREYSEFLRLVEHHQEG